MSDQLLTTRDVAARFKTSAKKVSTLARQLEVGVNLGGSAGFRFTEADVQAMLEALSVKAAS